MGTIGARLIKDVFSSIHQELTAIGYKKRKHQIYTVDLNDKVLGFIGFGRVYSRKDGVLTVIPTIGVRHQELERQVAEYRDQAFRRFVPPTFVVQLGFLIPQKNYYDWEFSFYNEIAHDVRGMIGAIREYGLPFIEGYANPEDVQKAILSKKYGSEEDLRYQIPIVHIMRSETADAIQFVEKQVIKMKSRTDPAADEFRKFARKLLQEYNTSRTSGEAGET